MSSDASLLANDLFVKSLNVLVDVTRLLIVLGVAEPLPPVTEVRGYHKAVGRILEKLLNSFQESLD